MNYSICICMNNAKVSTNLPRYIPNDKCYFHQNDKCYYIIGLNFIIVLSTYSAYKISTDKIKTCIL